MADGGSQFGRSYQTLWYTQNEEIRSSILWNSPLEICFPSNRPILCIAISKIRAAENLRIFSGPWFSFKGFAPGICRRRFVQYSARFREVGVAVGVDVLQRLLLLSVFVSRVVDERWNGLAAVMLPAGNVVSGQAAFLHFVPDPAQILGTVQIPPVLQPLQNFKYSR